MSPVILCRYGELFLKLGNRGRFEQQLVANVRSALRGLPGTAVESPHGRILVRAGEDQLDEACARVERVFGLVSISPARQVPAEEDLNAITEAAVALARQAWSAIPPAAAASASRRAGRTSASPSARRRSRPRLGAAVNQATGVPVDLTKPALVVGVEVSQHGACVYADTRPAPGGLPVGTAGKAVLLLSGGIDSPVAGWLAAKRGLALRRPVFPLAALRGRKVARTRWSSWPARWPAGRRCGSLHVVHFTDSQKRLRDAGPAELAVVLYRRMMMRVADLVADRLKAQALVTGENLGQVASQTADQPGHHRGGRPPPGAAPAGHLRQARDHRPGPTHRHLRPVRPALRGLLLAVRPAPPRHRRAPGRRGAGRGHAWTSPPRRPPWPPAAETDRDHWSRQTWLYSAVHGRSPQSTRSCARSSPGTTRRWSASPAASIRCCCCGWPTTSWATAARP